MIGRWKGNTGIRGLVTTSGIWAKCSAWRLEEKKRRRRKVRVIMVVKVSVWDWVRELEKRKPAFRPTGSDFKFLNSSF